MLLPLAVLFVTALGLDLYMPVWTGNSILWMANG